MTRQHRIAVQAKISAKDNTASVLSAEDRTEFKENDNISHFICRLAYCRNEELRRWYLNQETRLFNIRLSETHPHTIKKLLESKLDIVYQEVRVTDQDWEKFEKSITFKHEGAVKGAPALPSDFVRVPFKEAISLVGRRAVFLHQGMAYVPIKELQQIATAHFRARLSAELNKAFKYLPQILKDERLSHMLINLSNHSAIDFNLYEGKAPDSADKINLADLDFYSRKSFPPCMKSVFTALRNKHHLKHFGRL